MYDETDKIVDLVPQEDMNAFQSLLRCLSTKNGIKEHQKTLLSELLQEKNYNTSALFYVMKDFENECLSIRFFPLALWKYLPHDIIEKKRNELEDMKKELEGLRSPKTLDNVMMPVYNLLSFFRNVYKDHDVYTHLRDLPIHLIPYVGKETLELLYKKLHIDHQQGKLTNGIEGGQAKYRIIENILKKTG